MDLKVYRGEYKDTISETRRKALRIYPHHTHVQGKLLDSFIHQGYSFDASITKCGAHNSQGVCLYVLHDDTELLNRLYALYGDSGTTSSETPWEIDDLPILGKLPDVSLVIPIRNEWFLEKTIASLRLSMQALPELVLVMDGPQATPPYIIDWPKNLLRIVNLPYRHGSSRAMHEGIKASSGLHIVTLEAHMGFPTKWLGVMLRYIACTPRNIVCCSCEEADQKGDIWSTYSGANLVYGTSPEETKLRTPLGAKKTAGVSVLTTGIASGHCYGFTRARYKEIGEPWKYGRGLGYDAQDLSLTNWICGGETIVAPIKVRHTSPSHTDGHTRWLEMLGGGLYNSLRLQDTLPFTEYQRKSLSGLTGALVDTFNLSTLQRRVKMDSIKWRKHKEFLETQERDMMDYFIEWGVSCGDYE